MALFRDEAPVLDATKTKCDDLAQVASAGEYATLPGIHANLGVNIFSTTLTSSSTSQALFTVPFPISVLGVVVRFETASSSGTLQIEETPSGTAVGSGTNLLSGTISLAGTAATNTYGTVATLTGGAVGYPGSITPVGYTISAIIGGTMTSLAGAVVTIYWTRSAIK